MLKHARLPVLGFAAFSGVGKTSLLTKLLPLFAARNIRVGMIKHAHHNFDIDHPGKDSYLLRKAGASQMLVASGRRWALMVENDAAPKDPQLDELLQHLLQDRLDLILVEGFKHERFPKIELHRPGLGHPLLCKDDDSIIAIASDDAALQACDLPRLDINNPQQIAAFIVSHVLKNT